MSQPQRYIIIQEWCPIRQEWQPYTKPDLNGKWVLWSDVEPLLTNTTTTPNTKEAKCQNSDTSKKPL